MSIDIMKEKGVYDVVNDVVTPMKEFNHSDTEPIFRANGYQLELDSANSDFMLFDVPVLIPLLSDLTFSVTFSYRDLTSTSTVFSIGSAGAGLFYLSFLSSGLLIYYLLDENGNVVIPSSPIDTYTDTDEVHTYSFDGYKIYKDGVEIKDISSFSSTAISIATNKNFTVNRSSYLGSSWGNMNLHEFIYQGEKFLLEESTGNTITGDSGTIGTINTSHADGLQYIDAKMWDKKSFALEFDSGNSEYAEIDTQVGWVNLSDANFKVKFEIKGLSTVTRVIYCDGKFKDTAGGGVFRVLINPNVYSLFIYLSGTNNANALNISPSTLGIGVWEIEVSNLNVIVNGSIVYTYIDQQINLTSNSFKPTISKISYDDLFYSDFTYYGLEINNIPFNLTEGLGNQIYGSDGTIGTINTSHADGIQRINYGMWEKKGNVLKFERDNGDYLEMPYTELSKFSDISFSINLSLTFGSQGQIFNFGSPSSGGAWSILLTSLGQVFFQCFSQSNVNIINDNIENITENVTREYSFDGTSFYVDGVLFQDYSAFANEIINTSIVNPPRFGAYYNLSAGRFLTSSIYSCSYLGEQFLFREGQGITTTGSNGTVATINTSHADGTDYINSKVWNVESSKWIDYE